MSRGQKPRTRQHFPRMKWRARKRHKVIVFSVDGARGAEVYGMFWMRLKDVPKGFIWAPNPFTDTTWRLADNPLDASAWLDGAR